MAEGVRPTFLVIGAPKAGTTSLHRYLNQHPEVFMSAVKEPHAFLPERVWRGWCGPGDQASTSEYIADPAQYEALFRDARHEQARGESSVFYYLYPELIPVIREALPDVRIVALLRDPVRRAFSNWLHLRRDKREPESRFGAALAMERDRLASGWRPFWGYEHQGRYAQHLGPWLDAFGDRMHVMVLEDLKEEPVAQMQELFRFLGVDADFVPDTRARYNISGQVRSDRIRKRLIRRRPLGGLTRYLLPHGTRRWIGYRLQRLNTRYPEVDDASRTSLTDALGPDTAALEARVGRRMPWFASGGPR